MRWIIIFFVFSLGGCASSVIALKHEAPLEVYVVTSREDWLRAGALSFEAGDVVTINRPRFRCAHELKRDLHQCIYFPMRPVAEICSTAQAEVERELGGQLARPLSVRHPPCGGASSKEKQLYVFPVALVFDSRVTFDLTYNRISYGTRCASGKVSSSTGRGTCSWNGGVAGTAYGWVLDGEFTNSLRSAYSNPDRLQRR